MNIAVDFDNTITADRELFKVFIELARTKGHDVRIVTCRGESFGLQPVFDYAATFVPELKVINTTGQEKHGYCMKYHDWNVDIWIDDNPHWVGTHDKDEWSVRPVE